MQRLPTRPAGDLRRRRRQLARFFPETPLASRIEVLPEPGLVYVRNPKVATSTLLHWLDETATGRPREAHENVRQHNALPAVATVGWERVMRMIDGEAFRFSFVRDPLSRFESAYRSKMLTPTPSRERVLGVLGRPADDTAPVTFEEFLGAVEQQEPLAMDLHWRPQHLNLMHPIMTFDVLGRLETFDRDMETIRARLDLPSPPVHTRNTTSSGGPSHLDGRPDLVERVRALYADDLEIYGY